MLATILSLKEGQPGDIILILGTFALGFQKLLPSMQQVFRGWSSLKANSPAIEEVLAILDLKDTKPCFDLPETYIKSHIELKDLSFSFNKNRILNNISLKFISTVYWYNWKSVQKEHLMFDVSCRHHWTYTI